MSVMQNGGRPVPQGLSQGPESCLGTGPTLSPRAGLGADVRGIHARSPLSSELCDWIHAALKRHSVLVLEDQELDDASHHAFARALGPVMSHPMQRFRGRTAELVTFHYGPGRPAHNTTWHTDVSWAERPPSVGILRPRVVPPRGGDTCWVDMQAVYASLPEGLKRRLGTMRAEHGFVHTLGRVLRRVDGASALDAAERAMPAAVHPVICKHPRTGQAALFVNPGFTTAIVGMTETESLALLTQLYKRIDECKAQARVVWRPGTLVIWDEQRTAHRVVNDYLPHERRMSRVLLEGEKPRAA